MYFLFTTCFGGALIGKAREKTREAEKNAENEKKKASPINFERPDLSEAAARAKPPPLSKS